MEHIRAAIEKARQERLEGRPPLEQVPRPVAQAEQGEGNQMRTNDAHLDQVWTALPAFNVKPQLMEENRLVAYTPGADATPYDIMRTNLLQEFRAKNWTRIAVTSPTGGCGKTTLALNLGFSLARQHDIRTMVVELDMRRPSIATKLGIVPESSVADVLAGTVLAGEHLSRHGRNLAFAICNGSVQNPAELLQGVAAAKILDEIEARYQPNVMIFDMPPMLSNDDTIAFVDQVDCAVLMGAAEKSTVNEISRCQADLAARTNVLGVVLNKCRYLDDTERYQSEGY